jgi:hypothetical protein
VHSENLIFYLCHFHINWSTSRTIWRLLQLPQTVKGAFVTDFITVLLQYCCPTWVLRANVGATTVNILQYQGYVPITVAARSKTWTVFARSNTGIVGLNPTRGMDVYVRFFCVCVVLCVGSGLATGWSLVQGVLPSVYRLRNWKSSQGPQGL